MDLLCAGDLSQQSQQVASKPQAVSLFQPPPLPEPGQAMSLRLATRVQDITIQRPLLRQHQTSRIECHPLLLWQ